MEEAIAALRMSLPALLETDCSPAQPVRCTRCLQVGYFHGYLDGVDYVFVDHACFQGRQGDIYGGDRQSIQFRFAVSVFLYHTSATDARSNQSQHTQ